MNSGLGTEGVVPSAGQMLDARVREMRRHALDAVLSSEGFDRSRTLSRILDYICSKYFDGQADEIKEYNIAVEALGRPADFDPKKDAIVRVEIHRLRKRLRAYYENGGASDPVQIVLPEKGYVPEFVTRSGGIAVGYDIERGRPDEPLTLPEAPRVERWRSISRAWIAVAAAFLLLGVASVVWLLGWTRDTTEMDTVVRSQPAAAGVAAPVAFHEIRILAGRGLGTYTDRDGQVWEGDGMVRGGEAVSTRSDIVTRGFDRNLFGGLREGSFEYAIPLKPGSYEAELIFAETMYGEGNPLGGGEGSRTFTILANGKPLIEGFDVLAYAGGPNLGDAKVFRDLRPGPDGMLRLRFAGDAGHKAFVNAIRIRPGTAGKMNPVRIVARSQAFHDSRGNWWQPDRYYQGGIQIFRPTAPWGSPEAYLYQGERYGTFSYAIPVPPGRYSATLYFWEYWWSRDGSGAGGAGKRSFDVYCNFRPLLTGFDVAREAGASMVVKRTFRGLEPNSQGKLVFAFVPYVNQAMVNAIEVVDEVR